MFIYIYIYIYIYCVYIHTVYTCMERERERVYIYTKGSQPGGTSGTLFSSMAAAGSFIWLHMP